MTDSRSRGIGWPARDFSAVLSLLQRHKYNRVYHSTAQYSTVQHNTVQHSTVQYSTAQHSTAQYSSPPVDRDKSEREAAIQSQDQGHYSSYNKSDLSSRHRQASRDLAQLTQRMEADKNCRTHQPCDPAWDHSPATSAQKKRGHPDLVANLHRAVALVLVDSVVAECARSSQCICRRPAAAKQQSQRFSVNVGSPPRRCHQWAPHYQASRRGDQPT
jgi:hypothetical protein